MITVAHRLATVRAVDQLIYLADGRIVARGNLDELRIRVTVFDQQAALLGLQEPRRPHYSGLVTTLASQNERLIEEKSVDHPRAQRLEAPITREDDGLLMHVE